MILTADAERRALLERSTTIAIVGASANPARPSAGVFRALRRHAGLTVTPINPGLDTVDGVRAYRTLAAYAADHGAPDIVDVFRNPADAAGVAREAVAVGAKAIWFQLGVASDEAIATADDAGLAVVSERCIKVDAARFLP